MKRNQMKTNYILVILSLSALFICAQDLPKRSEQKAQGEVPADGYVPDATTATSIAEAVLIPIYGKQNIQGEKPFKAVLTNGIWILTGHMKEGYVGGVAEVQISKRDGCILQVTHGK